MIKCEMKNVSLPAFEADKRKRWIVERGLEIVSEASRHLSADLKQRHAGISWSKVAGIGNILRHDYERIAHDVLWYVVKNDLPILYNVCREELAGID